MLSAVARKEFVADGVAVSLVLPSITATEFGEGLFRDSANVRPGMVAHDPGYVARVIGCPVDYLPIRKEVSTFQVGK